jgi:hypothetical protein
MPSLSKESIPASWDELVNQHLDKMKKKDRELVSKEIENFNSIEGRVKSLACETSKRLLPNHLSRIKPIVEHIEIFMRGITTLAQAQSNPIALIVGCLDLLLSVSLCMSQFEYSTSDDVHVLARKLSRENV